MKELLAILPATDLIDDDEHGSTISPSRDVIKLHGADGGLNRAEGPESLGLQGDEMPLTVGLHYGEAELMGDGLVIVIQEDETSGLVHNVTLTRGDLEVMLSYL